ncbi:MAG: UDP-N-acetylmuramate--L-alanine ligase [Intestinibacter sp.]|uniref:UDP-N-acetylmuramate--L-alanine ligase n=2 Tax=Intestinibacter sp. TaxID=1965304 RepID=UPI002A7F7330|nr:UDP-N-acetylmuramate--L-alanine ligase [Intestinibacter sp.]MDY4573460.1 UDP-N-acetylmuramate--L-alanine ligase [Intestinibacter sp.]
MNIHFIGIGGISMSALAEICLNKKYNVSGSDMNESDLTRKLRDQGAKIFIGQCKENITDDIDIVVYTAAIHPDNPELVEAKNKNKLTINRAAFLGQLMREYKNSIAVSGTHGKTTTTSILSTIFEHAELDPTILVGGNLKSIGGNVKIGHSSHFITEACEYVDSFLNFNPKISIVLNIEEDHLDYFSGIDEIKASFNKFGKLLPKDGYFIINGDSPNMDILHDVKAHVVKYGKKSSNDVIIENISFDDLGCGSFDLNYSGKHIGNFKLHVPGLHNIYNATSAIIASIVSGIDVDTIKEGLLDYTGVGRRFEIKGKYHDATVIDDYAHHPTEIKATLSTAKRFKKGTLWCVFQPHTYSRTISLLDEFSEAFYSADKVIITDIFAAREDDPGTIHSKDLVERLNHNNVDATYISKFEDIVKYLKENIKPDDIVMTVGAGPVYLVGEDLLKQED